jgi:hypothetical protein
MTNRYLEVHPWTEENSQLWAQVCSFSEKGREELKQIIREVLAENHAQPK